MPINAKPAYHLGERSQAQSLSSSTCEFQKFKEMHFQSALGKAIQSVFSKGRRNKKKDYKKWTFFPFIPDGNRKLLSCDSPCMTCEKSADVCTSCPEGNLSASSDKFASNYNILSPTCYQRIFLSVVTTKSLNSLKGNQTINSRIQATGHALGNMG